MANYGNDLVRRLYKRYSGENVDRPRLDDLMREEPVIALIGFLFEGLERRDLQDDEVAEAIELARTGKLLKSSAWLLDSLRAYQRSQLPP